MQDCINKTPAGIPDKLKNLMTLNPIIGPVIGFAVIKFFNLSGIPAGVLLIQSCMPSAILCYLIAHMYSPKEIVDNISSTIVVSTIMSLFTIPITLFFALKYFY